MNDEHIMPYLLIPIAFLTVAMVLMILVFGYQKQQLAERRDKLIQENHELRLQVGDLQRQLPGEAESK